VVYYYFFIYWLLLAGGYGVGCSGDITLADMQGLGQELGTVVRGPYKIADVVALARSLLA
jgi:hypothetical protein